MKNRKLNIISILLCLSLTAVAQNKKEDFYFDLGKQPYKTFSEVDSADTTTWKLIKNSRAFYYDSYNKYLYKNGKIRYKFNPYSSWVATHTDMDKIPITEFIFDHRKHKKIKTTSQELKKVKVYKYYHNINNERFWKCLKFLVKKKTNVKYYKLNDCFNVYMIEKINDNEYWKYEVDWSKKYKYSPKFKLK